MKWIDGSTYSQGDKERIPNVWRIQAGSIRVSVHRHIHHPKEDWLVTCEPFFSCKTLIGRDVEDAQREAVELVRAKLKETLSKL